METHHRQPDPRAMSPPSSASAERSAVRVVVVKWDKFSGTMVSLLAKTALGNADVRLFHRADEALASLRSLPADLGIFGLTLPDRDGLDLLAIAAKEKLASKRLVLTWRSDERVRQVLKEVRIHGLLETISDGPDRLTELIEQAMHNKSRAAKCRALPGKGSPPLDRILSQRELQVLAALADRSDDVTASDVLGLRPSTVHTHRQRIMGKLGVQTRAELIREAMRRGVIRFTDTGVVYPGLQSFPDRERRS